MKRSLAATALLLAAVLSVPATGFAAEDYMNILIILDASGSMAAKMGNEPKMDVAKRVVRDLVGNMPSSMRVGLVVYGSKSPREKNDCADIDLAQPVGAPNALALDAVLKNVKPKGMTPIGAALREAAESLKMQPGRSTVVLVTDGTETCKSDPCQVAREIRTQTGIDVKIHVVGFDIESADRNLLECVANQGGGQYFAANSAAELQTALAKATERPKGGGSGPMWLSIAHPGLGEWKNSGKPFWEGIPKKKFWLGLIPGFGWPGYLQVVSAIEAAHGQTNDWMEESGEAPVAGDPGQAGPSGE